MESSRLPLIEAIEPRDISQDKDSFASNILYDKNKNGTIYAVKRPGILSFISGSGQALGIYEFDDDIYQFMGYPYYWNSIYNNGFYIALGGNFGAGGGTVYGQSSTDGINWTTTTITTAYGGLPIIRSSVVQSSVAYFVTDGNGVTPGKSFSTADGITWTTGGSFSSVNNGGKTLCSNGSLLLSTGVNTAYSTSVDNGVTWTGRVFPGSLGTAVVSANSSIFIALPNRSPAQNTYYTSTDGINWTTRTHPLTINWGTLIWSSTLSLFCAVTNSNAGTNYIYTTPDGINWTQRLSPTGLSTSRGSSWGAWTGSEFYIAFNAQTGRGGIVSSSDGVTYTLSPDYCGITSSGAFNSGTYVTFDGSNPIEKSFISTDSGSTFIPETLPAFQYYTPTVT